MIITQIQTVTIAYAAKNPEHGATLTYFLKDSLLTAKEKRQQAEKKMVRR